MPPVILQRKLDLEKLACRVSLCKMKDFEKKVLKEVLKIPLGEVRTYKWIAEKAGYPGAYRAVGNILKKNPYPFFIPCHRVIKSSKEFGGYSLGGRTKAELIKFERKIKNVLE